MLKASFNGVKIFVSEDRGPSYQHEYLRRKLESGVKGLWNYFSSQLKELDSLFQSGPTDLTSHVDDMLVFGAEHHRYCTALTDFENLKNGIVMLYIVSCVTPRLSWV